MKNRINLILKVVLSVVVCIMLVFVLSRLNWSSDQFVFLTIQESSLNALTGWPLITPENSQIFIDADEKMLFVPKKVNLFGVCLGIHYSALSQGVEFDESLTFSRMGRTTLNLPAPVSSTAPDIDGNIIELVNNQARVVRGKLTVQRARRDGTVHINYGSEKIKLAPGESWAELLVLEPTGPRRITAEKWQEELQRCFDLNYPATRLAIANRGLWPKSGVKAEIYQ